MDKLLREILLKEYIKPINSAKDCDLLSKEIYIKTKRKISSTTLRRFFDLLPSKSNLSTYNLDTLAIFCDTKDYQTFTKENIKDSSIKSISDNEEINNLRKLTQFTLNSISKKTLGNFENTIPREEFNKELNKFLQSKFSIYTVIAPGGYGKSIALAHWVSSLNSKNHEILFCSASIFYQLISLQNNLKNQINIRINDPNNYFEQFKNNNKQCILVIDSLDELSSNTKKIDELLTYIIELEQYYHNKISLKIVFSIRESFWKNIVKQDVIKLLNAKKLYHVFNNIESEVNEFSTFSVSEIKKLININCQKYKQSFQYNAIPFILQDLIRIPINLYFLFELLKKEKKIEIISSNSLNRKYLKEFVFDSKYSEYKEDIIWKIIDLVEKEDFLINKNLLKKHFPIHLKRETEFYNAYKELITTGIIHEERVENKYGIFTTLIGFKHQNFYYYLSSLNQIKKNDELNYSLFERVCNSDKNEEWKNNVVSVLYEIAYEDEDYNTLEKFCDLPAEIISSLDVRFSVGNSFRINNSIRNKLIQKYATCSAGQVFFFEQFVDTNFIINNYDFRINEYLKHKKTKEAQLFGNSILFLSGFLKMNSIICVKQFEIINKIKPDSTIHPWPIGRKTAYQILYHYFVENKPISNLLEYIHNYQSIAYEYPNYLNNGVVEFELSIFISLLLTKEYKIIIQLYNKIINIYNIEISTNFSYNNQQNQNVLPFLFSEFAKFKLGQKVADNYINILEKTIDNFPSTFDDFQYKIILKYFLSDFYKDSDIKKAKEYFELALKLSQFAQYDFYTAFLLINNPTKDSELIREAEEMLKKSGFSLL